jgi:hypothetical protein
VKVVYSARKGKVEAYYGPKDMEACLKKISESMNADKTVVGRLASDCKIEHDKLVQAAADIDKLDLVSLPEDTLHKVYSILLKQYTEVSKFSNIISAASKDSKLAPLFLENNITKDYVGEALSSVVLSSNNLFIEVSERLQKKEEFVMHMTPEEVDCGLHGGVFEDWEIESRFEHYILVYDMEKDDPHVYTGERARVMEVSLGLEKK